MEIDLDATFKDVVNEHATGLDFDENAYQESRAPPASEVEEIHRAMWPDNRRKMMNLRYLTRLRGLVKVVQLVSVFGVCRGRGVVGGLFRKTVNVQKHKVGVRMGVTRPCLTPSLAIRIPI